MGDQSAVAGDESVADANGEPTAADIDRSDTLTRLSEQMRELVTRPGPIRTAEGKAASQRRQRAPAGTEPARSGPAHTEPATSGPASKPATNGPARTKPAKGAPGHPEDDPGDPEAVAKAICLRLLTSAARPRAGLAAALTRKGIPADVAERVLDRLAEVGLIDDEAYAQSFVAGRHRHGGLGAGALREELKRKGVDARTAASAVAVVDHDAEYQRARILLERRVDSAMTSGPDAARRRLLGLLARRGYPADLAHRVVQEVMSRYESEMDENWS